MDNAEQSPRPPSKGIFDTASLLGIPSPLTLCKANALPNLIGVSSEKIAKLKSSEKKSNHAKHSEKTKTASNNFSTSVSLGAPIISGNQNAKATSKKSSEGLGEQIVQLLGVPEKNAKRKSKPKSSKNDAARNGKKSLKEKKIKKSKEKKVKKSSSESEGHMESSGSSNGVDSSNVVSSSSSDSSDEEEREKQQKKLAKLKKQQQELRRQVQELKQASHESIHAKPETHVKKVSSSPKTPLAASGPINHTVKPVPSPAHSLLPTPSKAISPETVKICDPILDEEQNAAFPLDLCMKKQEPTFEVTTSVLSSYIPSVTTTVAKKKPYQNIVRPAGTSNNKAALPKKRGRKPKPNQMLTNVSVPEPEKVRQMKRHSIKDITSLFMSPKMDLLPSQVSNPSLLKTNNSSTCPKVHAPNTLTNSNDILPHPRKNFTLDSLLSETNGNLDIYHHYPDIDKNMFTGPLYGTKNQKPKERPKTTSNSVHRAKKFEEKVKESESPCQFETSSPSDSDPDDDNSDSDDSEQSHSESLADGGISYGSHKRKRSYDDGEDYRNKKKRILPDEREVQIPLEHGWRRETRVRCFSRSGVRGEVTYYAPCGKKLRSYPEVERYLIKNGITDISRDNFTFSTKVNIGEFLESSSSGSGQDYVLLNEQEVVARIEEAKVRKGRLGVQNRKSSGGRSAEEEEQQRQWEQKQIQHHIEQQEKFREYHESRLLRQAQREQALMAVKEEKKLRAEESRKQKEQQRMMKQQEKFERLEQMRIEREIRAQQLLEEQEMKRQQAVFLREQERERRRQHMILVRALENRKKQEERERKREEILFEKRINREKKMEQRRIELDYLRELKKPVDDMMLKDLMPLPTLNRIPGVKLCGKAFADILMVFEFLHNFGETLGFDMESLPTLNTMQCALLNLDEKCEEEMMSVVHHLLVCAIDDPGVPHNSESATVMGQNIKDADITNNNVSEVLRLYFIAQDKRSPMLEWLQVKPFLSLNPSQKAEIIAYLCDELLTSRLLTRQIDSNIENVNVLRKDKWLVEGDLRRYRSIQQRRALKARLSAMEENRDNPNCANMLSADLPDFSLTTQKDNPTANEDPDMKDISKCDKEKLDDIESELANESGNESDDTQAPGQISEGEDEDLHLSNDEINKKIEKLSKQLTQCSNKLTKAFYTIRGATFGMDRYHRRYWVLPKSGGVFVESMESSLKPVEREKVLSSSKAVNVKMECGLESFNSDEIKESEIKEISTCLEKSEYESKSPVIDSKENEKQSLNIEKQAAQVSVKEECENVEKNIESASAEKEKTVKCEEELKSDIKQEINQDELTNLDQAPNKTNLFISDEKDPIVQQNQPCDTDKETGSKTIPETNEMEKSDKNLDNNSEIDAEEKPTVTAVKPTEFKLNPLESSNTDSKNMPDFQFSQKKKIWTVDKGDYNSPLLPTIKKENDPKIKKEDKKERIKESEKKFDRCDFKEDKKSNVNIFMPNFNENINLDLGASKIHGSSDRSHAPNPSMPPDQNWLLHSPLFASILAGNMLFNGPLVPQREMNGTYFNLPKNDSNNPFGPFLGLQQGMLSEQIFKSLGEKPNSQKPWFSILPRMPCDESLLSTAQPPRNSTMHSTCDARSSSNRSNHSSVNTNMQPGQVASALSNLQMELMNGVPPGFFLHPFLPPQFGPTFQSSSPVTCSSHHSASFTSTLSHTSPMHDFGLSFGRSPEVSTPNSIPTPSATPGPGCTTPTSRDSPSPGFTKRFMMEKMTQEYEAPQPINVELQRGWWRVDDPNQLKTIISALHHRGIREKMFQKQLQKHFQFACTSCSQGRSEETALQLTELDEQIKKIPGNAPDPDPLSFWYRNIALRIDMAILEQVENLEEKVDGSSMQVKFWKPPAKLSTEPLSKFLPSCEMYVHRNADDIYDAIKNRSQRKGSKKNSSKKKKPVKKEIELEEVEKKPDDEPLEPLVEGEVPEANEPVAEEPEKPCLEEKIESDILPLPPGIMNPVEEAKKRLLKVEAAIERRYLRPPLGINTNDLSRSSLTNSSSSSTVANQSGTGEGTDEELPVVPPGLFKWRNAVQNCRTAAQLAMCLNFLESCTAWDKSIMRASCQFCHSGDNEEKLLLCDGCDKGYHTYCFKPVMETIPDGDWYCFECLNKATGDNVCVICGIKGKLIECETCPKTFHLTCLEPPLSKMPKGKWYCSGCSMNRPKKSSKKSSTKEKDATKEPKESPEKSAKKAENTQPSKSKTTEKKEKKEKNQNKEPGNKDLVPCSLVLEEMQKHEDAWPFLTPVNTKQFPTYRKVIKKPMDMATMRGRLDSGHYKSREDFANDARLIFDNCETFNEDDSPVGQAGHSMRAFFETRWSELCST